MKFFLTASLLAIAAVSAQETAPEAPTAPVAPVGPTGPVGPVGPTQAAGPSAPVAAPVKPSPSAKVPSGSNSGCDADFIVTRCLETEEPKATACDPTDYDCQCAAYEAIASCYNNCPKDPRSFPAQNQVIVYCAQASRSQSLERETATASDTAAATDSLDVEETTETGDATTTAERYRASNTETFSSGEPEETDEAGAAPDLMRSTGGMLLGVAGVVAFVL